MDDFLERITVTLPLIKAAANQERKMKTDYKPKTAKQINSELGVPDTFSEIIEHKIKTPNLTIPNLNSLLSLLATRLSMLGYKFTINKDKGEIKWWK